MWRFLKKLGIKPPYDPAIPHLGIYLEETRNLLAMWETQFRSLGWEDPLEKGTVTHSSILAWRITWTIPWGLKESDITE